MARRPASEQVVLDENQLKYEWGLWRPNHPIKRQVIADDSFLDILCTALGAGKTAIAIRKALLYGLRNPGARLLLSSPSYKQIDITIINTFKDVCPPSLWNHCMTSVDENGFKLYNSTKKTLKLPNGSEFYFMSSDNYEAFRGTQFAFGFLDELRDIPSKEAFYVLQARLRQPGYVPHMIVATTPSMAKLKWLYDDYIVQKDNGGMIKQVPSGVKQTKSVTDAKGNTYNTTYTVFSGLTAMDNPAVGVDYFPRLLASYAGYSQAFIDQELYGLWVQFSGNCYPNMSESMLIDMFDYGNITNSGHIKDLGKEDIKIRNMKGGIKNVIYGVDWGKTVRMLATIVDEDNKLFVIDERVIINADLDKIYEACSSFERRYGNGTWVCDPSDPSRLHDLDNGGFSTFGADRVDVANRINDTNGTFGQNKLFIERRKCTECIRELQNLTWADNQKKDLTIGPDHFSDILGYVIRYIRQVNTPFIFAYGVVD